MNPETKKHSWWDKVPASAQAPLKAATSFAAGLLIALVLYYVLYRVGLPSKPFIYAAF